jgi:hypothetical protein
MSLENANKIMPRPDRIPRQNGKKNKSGITE